MDYLESIIRPLLREPDSLSIVSSPGERGMVYVIKVHQRDMGRVIGKSGGTFKSIVNLMQAYSPIDEQVFLKLEEPDRQYYRDLPVIE